MILFQSSNVCREGVIIYFLPMRGDYINNATMSGRLHTGGAFSIQSDKRPVAVPCREKETELELHGRQ